MWDYYEKRIDICDSLFDSEILRKEIYTFLFIIAVQDNLSQDDFDYEKIYVFVYHD